MKHFITFLIIFFISLGSCYAATPEGGGGSVLKISIPKLELSLTRGERHAGEIEVENPTDKDIEVKVYVEDWIYKPDAGGQKDFGPAGTMPFSASKWITYAPSEVKLAPFSKKSVRYTVTVPQGASGGNYSVLFFECTIGSVPDPAEQGAFVRVAGRIGSLFLVRIKDTIERKGEISLVKIWPPSGNAPMEIETTFKNAGNVDVTLGGNLLIMDGEGKVVGRGDLAKMYTLPGNSSTRKTQWVGRLPKGVYDVLLTYDLGEGKAIVKEEKISIP